MTITRIFNAPVARVWKAWSDADRVREWWGPTGFTSPLAKMDFREGGISLVGMRAPQEMGGQDMYNTWTYQKIIPQQRIEFVLHFSDREGTRLEPAAIGLPPGIPSEVRHVITFNKLFGNRTEMTITEYGYTLEEAARLSKEGLGQCLDKMATSFAKTRSRAN